MGNSKISQLSALTDPDLASEVLFVVAFNGISRGMYLSEIFKKYTVNITSANQGGDFTYVCTHNLNTTKFLISITDNSGNVIPDSQYGAKYTSANSITFYFNEAITGTYTINILKIWI